MAPTPRQHLIIKILFAGAALCLGVPLTAMAATTNLTVTVGGETFTEHTFNSSGGAFNFNTIDNTHPCNFAFPADFYSESLKLQANSYAKTFFETSKPAPSGKSFIGKTYDFDLFTASNSQVTVVNKAVTISFTYTDADVSGMDESTLAPYRRGSSDSSWQLISGSTIDAANNKVTFSTTLFSSFALLAAPAPSPSPSPSPSPAPSPAPSGGGGGGGGYISTPTGVTFSGRAYPKSTVTVLKDAQIAATTIADAGANFSISVSGLSGGNYIFAVYSEDNKGVRSSLLTFPVSVTSGATANVSGIFIAPTITIDKEEVRRGENIAIFGQSVPQADITIAIHSEEDFFGKTVVDANGAYLYNFDTSVIDYGMHYAKSKASLSNLEISSFSQTFGFKVGAKTVSAKPTGVLKGDLNSDKRVNLIDFSITAYWYKRPSPPTTADLNGDGKVDLIDFSIMAFYWTG